MFGPCEKCGELERKNIVLREKNDVQFTQLRNLWEEKRVLKNEKDSLKDELDNIGNGLRLLNGAIYNSLFAGKFYSTLTINKYGSVVFTLHPQSYRRTITVGEIKVRLYDSRDSLYSVEITKFPNGVLNDILLKVMEERNLKSKNDVEQNLFEICTATPLNSFFTALDEIFTEVQVRYEKLLESLKPKPEPQKKTK